MLGLLGRDSQWSEVSTLWASHMAQKKKKKKHYTMRRGLRNAIFRPLNSPNGEQRTLDDLGTPSYAPRRHEHQHAHRPRRRGSPNDTPPGHHRKNTTKHQQLAQLQKQ